MLIHVKVLRFTPEKHRRPRFKIYSIECQPSERILDVLERIRSEQDSTLAYRRSCATGYCGSDAMRINGHNALACKTRISDLTTSTITLEPLPGLKVIKDLVVDMSLFLNHFNRIEPFLPTNERQTPSERQWIETTSSCIQCAACTTACPIWRADPQFIGPAALVASHRFLFDSRDRLKDVRKEALNQDEGIWRCRNAYECTPSCPQGIQITRVIAETRKMILTI